MLSVSFESAFVILFGAVFVNNVVLTQFLGLCPFMGVSGKLSNAFGLGLASAFVLTLATVLGYIIHHLVLMPLGAEGLRTLAFIIAIAGVVQFTELYLRRFSPILHKALGIYLPLITTNCAVLGVVLLSLRHNYTFVESVLFAIGAAFGFALVLVLFAMLRERIDLADVPGPFRGAPVAMITAGIMSLAFMGFTGLL